MPRRARKQSSTRIYHVMLRGINKQAIFKDDEDNKKFLYFIKDHKDVCEFDIYGYCLMVNHVHLLIKEGEEKLDQIIKRIGIRYAYWYNKKYSRCGHLFQDRYRSEAVESESYFITVLRYIHQNPIKAGLCKSLDEYKWSSYKNYLKNSGNINTKIALDLIGVNEFDKYMNDISSCTYLDKTLESEKISDTALSLEIEKQYSIKATMIKNEPKESMKKLLRSILETNGVSTRQLSRVTGISTGIIWKL